MANKLMYGDGELNFSTSAIDDSSSGSAYSTYSSSKINTLLNQKQNLLQYDTTPTSGSSNPVTSGGVRSAINSLNASSVGGSGKYISAISETNGIITATEASFTSSITQGSSAPITSGGVYAKTQHMFDARWIRTDVQTVTFSSSDATGTIKTVFPSDSVGDNANFSYTKILNVSIKPTDSDEDYSPRVKCYGVYIDSEGDYYLQIELILGSSVARSYNVYVEMIDYTVTN